ncbi:MAG: rhodanese-like domain-containing protein [Clostridium sp.]|uniref:rhodanese-like domain-containing protein n=1 Tax=Clostridium culturomicium TaxID=1499683 RepID=UPI000695066C|nr:rhodanese-like domain-containing protein [Clostridium culturomicium]MDU4890845.1 rhodanese-like domain-containing protein [Clostridium sp.]MDU7082193.1 rhodanese-like domain-containing protein [Clostridium sp.]
MKNISATELQNKIKENDDLVILDIREKEDYERGHIENAILLAQNEVVHEIENIAFEKDTPICVYCYSGNRSSRVAMILEYLGYSEVYNLGGIDKWTFELVSK